MVVYIQQEPFKGHPPLTAAHLRMGTF